MEKLTHRISVLEARVFTIDRFESDKDVTFYTGFPNTIVFESLFEFLDPGNKGENISYRHSDDSATVNNHRCDEDAPQARKTRTIKPKGRIFLTLCRLRQGFKEEHLSHLCGISQTMVGRITISWVNFMFLKFCKIPVWPSRAKVNQTCLLTSRTNIHLPGSSSTVPRSAVRGQRVSV